MMEGKIITIEGLDGAGKSTQIELLQKYMSEKGVKFKFIHYPKLNQGVYGELIAEYLRGEYGTVDSVHPKIVGLLFALDRMENKSMLTNWLSEGYWIIMDRYVKSNIAFQCAKVEEPDEKKKLKDWILNYEFGHNQLPRPFLSFFLNLPFEVIRQSLTQNREGDDRSYLNGKKDIHEDSLNLQKKVLKEYKALLREDDDFIRIDCFDDSNQWLSPVDIHHKIIEKLNNSLRAKDEITKVNN